MIDVRSCASMVVVSTTKVAAVKLYLLVLFVHVTVKLLSCKKKKISYMLLFLWLLINKTSSFVMLTFSGTQILFMLLNNLVVFNFIFSNFFYFFFCIFPFMFFCFNILCFLLLWIVIQEVNLAWMQTIYFIVHISPNEKYKKIPWINLVASYIWNQESLKFY